MMFTNTFNRLPATATSSIVAIAMAGLCGVALLGMPGLTTKGSLEATLQRTTRQISSGQAEAALAVLRPFRASHPDQPILDRQIALAYAALNRPADEAAAWESFLRKSSFAGDGCRRLVALQRVLHRDMRDIVATLQRCFESEPDQPELLAELARAYEATGSEGAAEIAYERAVQMDPENPLLQVRLGERMLASGRFADARRCAEAALRSAPDSPDAIRLAAAASEGLGDVADARHWIDRGLAARPGDRTLVAMRQRLAQG